MSGKELNPIQRMNLIAFLDEMTQDVLRRRERGERLRLDVCRERSRERERRVRAMRGRKGARENA